MTHRSIAESTLLAVVLVLVFGAIYALVARLALDGFPYSGDEYSLALQGELFAKGVLHLPAPPHAEWLRVDHVVVDHLVRSKYSPGGPALLSLGFRQGVAWLVTPIEGTFALAIVWHTVRRMLGAPEALVALVTLGTAPLFIFDAASFYAHMPTILFLAIAFAAVAQWTRCRCTPFLVIAGAAIGCAFLVRPIDAILFGVAMLAFRSPRAVIVPALAALPFVIANLVYQNAQFGSPFTDDPVSLQYVIDPIQLWNHIDIYVQMALQWTVPGTVIAALFGAFAIGRDHPARGIRTFAVVLIAVLVVALLPMISDPDDGPHPRYLSITMIPLALLAGAGFGPMCAAIDRTFGRVIRTVIVVCAVLFGLAQLGSFLQDRIPKQWKREGLYQAADSLPPDAIVVVRAQYPSRYARNGAAFDGVLYLSPPPSVSVLDVAAAYPDRPIWEAHEGVPWTLVRVR